MIYVGIVACFIPIFILVYGLLRKIDHIEWELEKLTQRVNLLRIEKLDFDMAQAKKK